MGKEKLHNRLSKENLPDNAGSFDSALEEVPIRSETGPERETETERIAKLVDDVLMREAEMLASFSDLEIEYKSEPLEQQSEGTYIEGGVFRKLNKKIRDHAKALGMATVVAGVLSFNAEPAQAGQRGHEQASYGQKHGATVRESRGGYRHEDHDNRPGVGRQIIGSIGRGIEQGIRIEKMEEIREMEFRIRQLDIDIRNIDGEIRVIQNQLRHSLGSARFNYQTPEDIEREKNEALARMYDLESQRDRFLWERQQLVDSYRSNCLKLDIIGSIFEVIGNVGTRR